MKRPICLALALIFSQSAFAEPSVQLASVELPNETKLTDLAQNKLLYTTYFYTAGEAIVHGYEKDTDVRIVSLAENRTIWEGKVGEGQSHNVPTGQGVFAFLADKKASILVGTPSSCTAVGYYVRDINGSFTAKRFLTELPSSVFGADNQLIVWAWQDTEVTISDLSADKEIKRAKIKAGERLVLNNTDLGALNSHMLDIRSSGTVSVQVYYDQGFHVPSMDGRVSGKVFRTYVGVTTEGHNDLNLINYGRDTKVRVKNIDTGEIIWEGKLASEGVKNLRLKGVYVHIESDDEISALVAPYNFQGYAQHHFSGGHEGTGIESNFITTTSEQLWVFSYFDQNPVQILSMDDEVLWSGNLNAGHAQGYHPGAGTYKIKSREGVSVMGGSAACGAEYSPAGGLFRIDEELFQVAAQIVQARKSAAQAEGREISEDELNAPLSSAELERAAEEVEKNTGNKMSPAAVDSRMKSIQTH